jgi:hypothetical protein
MSGARLAASFTDDFLAVRCIERFEDGSGFRFDVELRSGAFGADYPFFVELHPMMSFLLELAAIDNKLTGEALLKRRGSRNSSRFQLVAMVTLL